jgi:hypothetical protein
VLDGRLGVCCKHVQLLILLLAHAPHGDFIARAREHLVLAQPAELLQPRVAALGAQRVQVLAARAKQAQVPARGAVGSMLACGLERRVLGSQSPVHSSLRHHLGPAASPCARLAALATPVPPRNRHGLLTCR